MQSIYKEYKQPDFTAFCRELMNYWDERNIFGKSLQIRQGSPNFIFFEGPPSANGIPGIHHVMARAIKDIFCRFKTMKGFHVARKAGWDTHGLPIEIAVEKTLGITKDDIGRKISVADYNEQCRTEVMKYKDLWDDLTRKIGYWVDLENPYITFENKYIESVWWLLEQLYEKGLLYKGYSIQPYSPAAGTGLSTHELNQPGCYRMVKDNSVVAQFKVIRNTQSEFLFSGEHGDLFILAWTTTPWTLPSNTALAVGSDIIYARIKTYNDYTHLPVTVILAKELVDKYFSGKTSQTDFDSYGPGQKNIPYHVVDEFSGIALQGVRYEQLLPYAQPVSGDAFVVVTGDFVTTHDGTGIVHIAPSFGADDFRTAKQFGLGSLTMVSKDGRFTEEMGEFAGRYVKPEYDPNQNNQSDNVDIDIIVKLKKGNRAFKAEKYEHSYPHCWRTDKPILYYPLDSWFIRTTAFRELMIELNHTIQWKPEATGTGRFGNWLENLVDWNLSRSRYWGTPLPIWTTDDKTEVLCIGSIRQLKSEIEKSLAVGFMNHNPLATFDPDDMTDNNYNSFDLHRPYVDEIILVSASGRKMFREPDLIDVWFDSGAMPYAQFHFPFEHAKELNQYFPADFIAEGVDQTRGWFFTLHAISTMIFGSVAFKAVVSNGLVLDKLGNKMSKRLGNAVDPFETIEKFGPDATRWYMITNSQPWDNLKFDIEGVAEVQRRFFGTLFNTYSFFALYANIDGFAYKEEETPYTLRPEIDRWILSELNTLIQQVNEFYEDYEPTKAGRAIHDFVDEHLSNWFVRLSRRRFWKGDYSLDKISAYQTLYHCLESVAKLAAPIAPFYSDRLFLDLNQVTQKHQHESVHLTDFPTPNINCIDKQLEQRMQLAQRISSLVLSLRKKNKIRVRQPLAQIMLPITDENIRHQIEQVKNLILSEVNVKEIVFIANSSALLIKKAKPNFKTLGPRYGKLMKPIADAVGSWGNGEIGIIESEGRITLNILNTFVEITLGDIEIVTEDIPGWTVANSGPLTVALDITISDQLRNEGLARELINRIQNLRKEKGFEVTDKITVLIQKNNELVPAIENNFLYICSETLATHLEFANTIQKGDEVEITDDITAVILLRRLNAGSE